MFYTEKLELCEEIFGFHRHLVVHIPVSYLIKQYKNKCVVKKTIYLINNNRAQYLSLIYKVFLKCN